MTAWDTSDLFCSGIVFQRVMTDRWQKQRWVCLRSVLGTVSKWQDYHRHRCSFLTFDWSSGHHYFHKAKKEIPSLAKAKFEQDYLGPLSKVSYPPRCTVQLEVGSHLFKSLRQWKFTQSFAIQIWTNQTRIATSSSRIPHLPSTVKPRSCCSYRHNGTMQICVSNKSLKSELLPLFPLMIQTLIARMRKDKHSTYAEWGCILFIGLCQESY